MRRRVEPHQSYLLSTVEGLEVRWGPEGKQPPEWAYVTNKLGEQVYIYATHDLYLGVALTDAKGTER